MSRYAAIHAGTLKRAGFIFPNHNKEASRLTYGESDSCPLVAIASSFRFSYLFSKAIEVFASSEHVLQGFHQPGHYWPSCHFDWRGTCLALQ